MTWHAWGRAAMISMWLLQPHSVHAETEGSAQTSSQLPDASRYEVSGGVRWLGAVKFDTPAATLTTPAGDRFRLFSASTELERAVGFDVRMGRRIARRLQAEVAVSYASPVLSASISGDAENPTPVTATDSIRRASVEGGGLVDLAGDRASRMVVFATGGAGYLRELHEGNTLAQSGRLAYVGGGARFPFGGQSTSGRRQAGFRFDARAVVTTGDVMQDHRAHLSPVIVLTFFARL